MNTHVRDTSSDYEIEILPLTGTVTATRNGRIIAQSDQAKVMYETRLGPTIYFPRGDIQVRLSGKTALQTFCPFKGTANYRDLRLESERLENAVWSYDQALPESLGIEGHIAFMPGAGIDLNLGQNQLRDAGHSNISGPMVDWLLREAWTCKTPEELTSALADKLSENGVALSRMSILIWSLHPLIAGKNYIWEKATGAVSTFAPSYEIHDHPGFINSPLRHVSNGLGGIRQKMNSEHVGSSFPIIEDLRASGATDYVAMPLPFSDGRTNVLTLTCDHPDGFTTPNLGLIFECSAVISRYFEVFTQTENARSLLETYVGKRTGARVLGGKIRRGDGDDIDAAIMFCDLRDSTQLEETMGRAKYIDLLNTFFETTSSLIEANDGEVLKFIGDAVLAVFPAGGDPAKAKAQAVLSAKTIVEHLDTLKTEATGVKLDCAIGLAYGGVTYGNVGSRERLDFTVIGQAANIAARLGEHSKTIDQRIVVARDILPPEAVCEDLGLLSLHNVSRPVPSCAV